MSESLTKSFGSVLKWTGRYSFFSFVIALILVATTLSLADPHITEFRLETDEVGRQEFRLESQQDILVVIFSEEGDTLNIVIEKLSFKDPQTNETSDFRTGSDDVVSSTEILAVSTTEFQRVLDLPRGEYQILVEPVSEDTKVITGNAKFNLGLIVATLIMWAIFSVIFSVFSFVLPVWLILAIITAVSKADQDKDAQYQTYASQTQQEPTKQTTVSTEDAKTQSSSVSGPSFLDGTSLEKLTRTDWAWIIIGSVLFLVYLTNPFDSGPVLFLAFIVFAGVAYNFFEREKTKDRIEILMRSYPKSSIAFVAEQLDKKEDHIIEVLRIMILDEGYPIRLDLVNRSVYKIGPFPGENGNISTTPQQSAGPDTSSQMQTGINTDEVVEEPKVEEEEPPVEEENPIDEGDDEGPRLVRGEQGEISEPWAYCQACGESLKKKVKYCYSCGARQYQ